MRSGQKRTFRVNIYKRTFTINLGGDMNKLTSCIRSFLNSINNWRDKWVQSQIKTYLEDFKQRSIEHKEYWFEKMFLPIIDKQLTTAPNLISIFRGLMALPLLIFVLDERFGLALAFGTFIMLLDAIDGPLAKVLDQQSDLGEILDPMGDKLVFAAVFLTLGNQYAPQLLFISIIAVELVIVVLALFLRPLGKKLELNFKKKATIWGKIKLNVQVFACAFMLIDKLNYLHTGTLVNVMLLISLVLALISIVEYFKSVKKTTL